MLDTVTAAPAPAAVLTPAPAAPATPGRARGSLHERTLALAEAVAAHRYELLEILVETATRTAAEDEINRSVRALAGAAWELERIRPPRYRRMSVFLPSNNVLYSYVLLGMIPSFYVDRIEVRPSSRTRPTAEAVHELLSRVCGSEATGHIEVVQATQKQFVASCASSEAIVFTGQFENGLDIMSRIGPQACFLVFGSGPNPVVIGPEAAPSAVQRSLITSRLYNSGQDCLSADLFFVHRSIIDDVLRGLRRALSAIPVTDRRLPGAVVSPLVYADAARAAETYIAESAGQVVHGGYTDAHSLLVEPTVLLHESCENLHPPEYFCPIYSLVPYDDAAEIERWAATPEERIRGMYASVFGEPRLTGPRLGTAAVLREVTTFDHEDGNRPFGGYGVQAGCVRGTDGELTARPLLLSAELTAWAQR